jgi:hypothetical protein
VPFSGKLVTSISESDLLALIETKESESKEIDYKRLLPGKSDGDRREFLYDVSSFANTSGGYLIFGIDENEGLPTALPGLNDINADNEIRRLEEMARDGMRPPIPGLHTVAVPLRAGTTAIVMNIPRSWNPPHQVTYQKAFRFYGRDSNGKYQLDVEELRTVFARSERIAERMQTFRANRISKVIANDLVTFLSPGGRMVTHFLPLSAFGSTTGIDLRVLGNDPRPLVDLIGGFSHSRFNADGFVGWSETGYVQLFRSGSVEVVCLLPQQQVRQSHTGYLPSVSFEQRIFRQVDSTKRLLQSLSVECPIAVMVSFVGIKGWRMGVSPAYATSALDVFDRDPLLISEILVEAFDHSAVAEARPIVDAIWNAAGWPGSPHYDQDGGWDGNRL